MERVDYESMIISDLLGFYNSKALDISPWYQRRAVWSSPQKAYLINTIFERKPVPSIYIRQKIDIENEKAIKEVVDGQQRIRTILGYRNDEFGSKHPHHRGYLKYSQLNTSERGAFLSTPLSVGYLIGATDQDVIEIFGRINSVAKTLNPMEKLNAQFSGEFKQFCLNESVARLPFWRTTNIFSANDIARMQEMQFISDFTINLMDGQLGDYDPKRIASYYKEYDERFPQEGELAGRMEYIFERMVRLPPTNFSDTVFRSAQVTFSLMWLLDEMRDRQITTDQLREVIHRTDAQVTAAQQEELLDPRIVEGFTQGNLHRIRTRRLRHEVLENNLPL
jgi:Protein of unknown function DUF262